MKKIRMKQGNRETGKQGNRETGKQGNRETGKQGNRETGKQGNGVLLPKHLYVKSGKVYAIIIVLWVAIVAYLGFEWYTSITFVIYYNTWNQVFSYVLLTVNVLIMSYFWLCGIRDLVFNWGYFFNRKKVKKFCEAIEKVEVTETPKVLLLYCTCNDFIPSAVAQSMEQDYENFEFIILDDSKKQEYRNQIDEFVKERPLLKVVRRDNNIGFKAGNINNYLNNREEPYDYIVILDSDEVLPSNYIKEVLKYFYGLENVGGVQARHVACNDNNAFMATMSPMIDASGIVNQSMKLTYGQTLLFGHGITITREAYEKMGGFPHMVVEDTSFSTDLLLGGYDIVYAPNIICKEEYPVDYLALKKQQCRWTEGNVQYVQHYGTRTLTSKKLRWHEKLEIFLSVYNFPLMPFFTSVMMICVFTMGLLGQPFLFYSPWILIPMISLMVLPLCVDMFVVKKNRNFFMVIWHMASRVVIMSSLMYAMMMTAVKTAFGKKAVFTVTPKKSSKVSFLYAIKANWQELVFALVMSIIAWLCCQSLIPVILVDLACVSTIFVTLLSNIQIKKKETQILKIDVGSKRSDAAINNALKMELDAQTNVS